MRYAYHCYVVDRVPDTLVYTPAPFWICLGNVLACEGLG